MSRTIVVTGGGTGIGRAIALRFDAAGDTVVVTGRRPEPLKETVRAGTGRIEAVRCDGADPTQVRELAERLPGRVDVLVNNAGGNTDFDLAEPDSLESLADQWRTNFEANVLTAVLTTHALAGRIADHGSVISVGSIAADNGAGAYGAAKAALTTWNLSTAAVLGPRGITANVIAPGYIATTEFFRDRMTPQRRDQLRTATLNDRIGQPADIAETAYFLASDGARHITGQVLHVNGGARTTR
ncbi:3-oxoacyl-[acyl-carrier protein] reductase [Actinopolymorpha cephalotaxi]|uniref:3-oxoacyl-[acyl-carrier protein] reductase n=1 Tax=Actinopolymorpha cephalotaxi TaxID=504797 RepID=A0A1I2NCC2_9ACTN|nr:SDR family oxidoreductase [Actinopolymorpha cephalotaxi]NYH85587.1 3-oxoacyl-[acyl-carrier protein] reductase [Actinopolymorpha cephalotaxi]SFG01524.1 3-oxoacyl-[acyl-carrier protein] reductase [Actinopolymorpha cephalotaxi]